MKTFFIQISQSTILFWNLLYEKRKFMRDFFVNYVGENSEGGKNFQKRIRFQHQIQLH